jgi:molybdopterin synthase catalytic subunit
MEKIEIKILDTTLSIDTAYGFILDDQSGGNCLFIGTVRNVNKGKKVTHLDFETYKPMAIKEMQKIAQDCIDNHGAAKVAIHHRSGYVGIKDIAVIIAVSSGHRDGCFEACRYAIDQLKNEVPIWKKESLEDGSYWVGSRP